MTRPTERWLFTAGVREVFGHRVVLVCECGEQLADGAVQRVEIRGRVVTVDGHEHLCGLAEPTVRSI